MRRSFQYARVAGLLFLIAMIAHVAYAQGGPASESSDGFDFGGMQTVVRTEEHTYPLGDTPYVVLVNRFGRVVVETWPDPLVHLTATVTAGSETASDAERVAQSIEIMVTQEEGRLEAVTIQPGETSAGVGYTVDYLVQIPVGSSVSVENIFGDIRISGVGGGVSVDSRYGVIDLRNLAGPVRVRARGEFPLNAENLEHGGHFFLRGTQATFREIGGALRVSNYLGSVALHALSAVDVDVMVESGAIHLYLPEGPQPQLDIRADYGRIESEVALERDVWGPSELASLPSLDTRQRMTLHATFDNVYLYRPVAHSGPADTAERSRRVKEELFETHTLAPGQSIRIDAAPGNVDVFGTDDDRVTITATRRTRIADTSQARIALEGLALRVQSEGPVLRVLTLIQEDMEALGCTDYGIDLIVRCPKNVDLRIHADEGRTYVASLSGAVQIEQGRGEISVELLSGPAVLTNHEGPVDVENVTGRLTVNARKGDARLYGVSADADITVEDGKTVVDTPGGGLRIRATGGDVRIIALEGIRGNYDIQVKDGHLGLAAPETASATFWMNATGGTVKSSFPVTGTMERGAYSFQGRLNDGRYRVLLETRGGDIQVD